MEESRDPFVLLFNISFFPSNSNCIPRGCRKYNAYFHREQTYEVPSLSSVVGATGCSGESSANQQDSPKPTVVALKSARRGVSPHECARAYARIRGRSRREDRSAGFCELPASPGPAVGICGTGPERIDARSTESYVARRTRGPRLEPQPNHHGRRYYRFSRSSSRTPSRKRYCRGQAVSETSRRRGQTFSRATANRSHEKAQRRRFHSRGRACQTPMAASRCRRHRDTELHRYCRDR